MKLSMYELYHLRPSQWRTSQISLITNTNSTASQIVEVMILILLTEPMFLKLSKYSHALYPINHSPQ
jgi:hypothetical protein